VRGKPIQLRVQDFLGAAADQRLHDSSTTKPGLPFAIDLRRHARHAA
jgi:hypothetical protein